jgi:hypothetical protein
VSLSGDPSGSSGARRASEQLGPQGLDALASFVSSSFGASGRGGGCDEVLGLGRKLAGCRGGLRIAHVSRDAEAVFGSSRSRRVWGRVPRGTRWCSLVRCRTLRGVARCCGAAAVPPEAWRGLASVDLCALRGALAGWQLEAELFGARPRVRGRHAFPRRCGRQLALTGW